MKKFVLILLALFTMLCCGKDEETITLATPSLEWSASAISGNTLEISITINSTEDLPAGTLEFMVDGSITNTFQANKGTRTYSTDYSFDDMDAHSATLAYIFHDGRNDLNKTVTIQKSEQNISQKSSKNDWVDF